ncbi:MAG: VWA domain-containing protein [Armatimonadota bacterium]|nr:VWA domain-containing protein [Armatimonadota bacterium]
MIFGTPAALWWLLLVPLVIMLYMLRARREIRVVPSTLLWERATRDLVARMPVRRLERNLLLLLQILAVTVLALALARPSVALPGLAGDAVVIVIQTTASMQATDVAPTRFAAAQREALALLARLTPRQPAALLAAGRVSAIVQDFTTDRAVLAQAVRSLRPSDASGVLDDAVALAGSLRADGRPARVHVIGDRAPQTSRVQWHRIGEGAGNVAITAASVRLAPDGGSRILVRVEAFGGQAARTLVASIGGRPLVRRDMRITPGVPQVLVLDAGTASGLVTLHLVGRDALPADDRAAVAVGREALPRVLVVGEPNPVLDAVLRALPLAAVTRAERVVPAQVGRADLVVLDGLDPVILQPGAYLLIGTLAENLPLQIEGTVRDQVVRSGVSTHPVMRLVELRGLRVTDAYAIRLQGGVPLAEADVPLLWAYEGRGIRAVVLPFLLSQTDLPLHPAFPVLMANAVEWLAGSPHVTPGDAPIVAAGPWPSATLIDPAGGAVTVEARNGLFVLPPLDRVGEWRLRTGGWERRWVASAVDAREADLAVAEAATGQAATEGPQVAYLSLVPWLLGVAAAVIAGEWLLWSRSVPPDRERRRPR